MWATLTSTLDPRFKNSYNDDNQITAITSKITTELMPMATEEDSPTPGSSTAAAAAQGTAAAQYTAAEGGASGDDDTSHKGKTSLLGVQKARSQRRGLTCHCHWKGAEELPDDT